MKITPTVKEINPTGSNDFYIIFALENFLGKNNEQIIDFFIHENTRFSSFESLVYMGPIARKYYISVVEEYLKKQLQTLDLRLLIYITLIFYKILIFSKSDQEEQQTYIVIQNCLIFLQENFDIFKQKNTFYSSKETKAIWERLVITRRKFDEKLTII